MQFGDERESIGMRHTWDPKNKTNQKKRGAKIPIRYGLIEFAGGRKFTIQIDSAKIQRGWKKINPENSNSIVTDKFNSV